jgi:hypothetical protein
MTTTSRKKPNSVSANPSTVATCSGTVLNPVSMFTACAISLTNV